MSLIYTNQTSKKRNKTKKELAEYQEWLDSVSKQKTSFSSKPMKKVVLSNKFPKLVVPPGRETPKYPSKVTEGAPCTKPVQGKAYTGTAMKGIGTLHKSNAVPIFSVEEAKDQASMRR